MPSDDLETGSASSDVEHHGFSEGHMHGGSSSAIAKIKTKVAGMTSTLVSNGDSGPAAVPAMPEKLAHLVDGFRASDQAKITEAEVHRLHQGVGLDGLREVTSETTPFRTYKRASWWTQFKVLSSRAFKNLYRYGMLSTFCSPVHSSRSHVFRNPLLMATHYIVAIVVARESTAQTLATFHPLIEPRHP